MVQAPADRRRRAIAFVVLLSGAALMLAGVGQRPADADVTAVQGSAFNCQAQLNLFGNPNPPISPTADVALPPGGSATPLSETAPCTVRIQTPGGPGPFILSTGPVTVTTQGTTGPTGSVTSTATANDVGTNDLEALQATSISSTCTANESGVTGSTTVTGGTVVTDQRTTPETVVPVPQNPAPNTEIRGINGADDTYTYIFNEQILNPDGSLTVNAVHLILHGPNATGEVILGQVVCGVTATAPPTSVTPTSVTPTSVTPTSVTPTTAAETTTTTTVTDPTPTTTDPTITATTATPPSAGGGGTSPRVVGHPLARTGTGLSDLYRVAFALVAFGLWALVVAPRSGRAPKR